MWENSKAKVPKAPYQTYLDERAAILMAKGLISDESIGPVIDPKHSGPMRRTCFECLHH